MKRRICKEKKKEQCGEDWLKVSEDGAAV